MAHSRSALKRWRQSLKRRASNRSVKSRTRTLLTKAISLIDSDIASAESAVRDAISALDRAAQKGVIHVNAAARGKSRAAPKRSRLRSYMGEKTWSRRFFLASQC